jgi:hypothetical protein
MARTKKRAPKRRNEVAAEMVRRHPRTQTMAYRAAKRLADAKNHWSREWE